MTLKKKHINLSCQHIFSRLSALQAGNIITLINIAQPGWISGIPETHYNFYMPPKLWLTARTGQTSNGLCMHNFWRFFFLSSIRNPPRRLKLKKKGQISTGNPHWIFTANLLLIRHLGDLISVNNLNDVHNHLRSWSKHICLLLLRIFFPLTENPPFIRDNGRCFSKKLTIFAHS